jgi:ATP-dependent RNA helicase RhlE
MQASRFSRFASVGYTARDPGVPLSTFNDLPLSEPIQKAIRGCGYETPTPIQAQAIPALVDGRDVLGVAQTGTGKTAAFTLPMLQWLSEEPFGGRRPIRGLILTPTRELAAQIGESITAYGKHLDLSHQVVFGGVNEKPQIRALKKGFDILVACPGRLLDLHGRGFVDLGSVELFVLDEADRMLDMGFIRDLRRIMAELPRERQNLLFSATMPKEIVKLASEFLNDPVHVSVTPQATPVDRIEQSVYFTEKSDKRRLLIHLLEDLDVDRAIVFTRTKHGANRVVKHLQKVDVSAAAIHGNKSQNARTRALDGFRNGEVRVLVATDVASRGLDIDGVSHVFNFDLPNESESYVHRIGRTGRAGAEGVAIAFCDDSEGGYLRDIEKLTGVKIEPITQHPFHSEDIRRGTSSGSGGGGRKAGSRGDNRGNRRGGRGGRRRGRSRGPRR